LAAVTYRLTPSYPLTLVSDSMATNSSPVASDAAEVQYTPSFFHFLSDSQAILLLQQSFLLLLQSFSFVCVHVVDCGGVFHDGMGFPIEHVSLILSSYFTELEHKNYMLHFAQHSFCIFPSLVHDGMDRKKEGRAKVAATKQK
jgi:hypothetical protein